jgi:hypothetical protein
MREIICGVSLFLTVTLSSISAQVVLSQPHVGDKSTVVLPVQPQGGYTATLQVFETCGVGAVALSVGPVAVATGSPTPTIVPLANALIASDTPCAIEQFTPIAGGPALPPIVSEQATAELAPTDSFSAGAPVLGQPFTNDAYVFVDPASMGSKYAAVLTVFDSCVAGANPLSLPTPVPPGSSLRVTIPLIHALKKGDTVCLIEKYSGTPVVSAVSSAMGTTMDRLPGIPFSPNKNTKVDLSRISGGLDVSSSASVDPAARFLLDAAFDFPFSNRNQSLYNPWWGTGYIRLASIAQPGAISGLSSIGTYIKPLTDSTPNKLVQSIEGNFGVEYAISPKRNLGLNNSYSTVAFLIDGGIISPLSVTQANPVVYGVTQEIYNYYTGTASTNALGSQAAASIISACGKVFDSTKSCYLAYIPQDRTRFFRNYSAGLVIKKYYYKGGNTKPEDDWTFPGMVSATFGQNEYVTRGQLRGYVLHIEGSWPLPGTLGGKLAGGFYAFGAIDTNVSDQNSSTQQFILPTAGSTVNLTSPGVAIIPVAQPNRDRYRFGLAVDIVKLVLAASGK